MLRLEILVDQKMSSSGSSNSAGNIWFISCPLSEVSNMNRSKDPSSGDVRKATSWEILVPGVSTVLGATVCILLIVCKPQKEISPLFLQVNSFYFMKTFVSRK